MCSESAIYATEFELRSLELSARKDNIIASPISRRAFFGGAAAGVVGSSVVAWQTSEWAVSGPRPVPVTADVAPTTETVAATGAKPTGIPPLPGMYPGRVIEVNDPKATKNERNAAGYQARDRDAVRKIMDRGMKELVGSRDAVEAWKQFFKPGDRVGIKVNPVGVPDAISSHEVVLEIVDGLKSAGVKPQDILLFDRYKKEFVACGYHKLAEEAGIHWDTASAEYDGLQLRLDGQMAGKPAEDHVSGYDPDVFRELPFYQPDNVKDPLRFQSHLCNIVSKKIDKFIAVPVLKDHRSSGITFCLKNLSHGLVSNVNRSHMVFGQESSGANGKTSNQCGTFIPAMVSLPPTRAKAVLQIGDSLVATYEGGPGNWNGTWGSWNNGSLFFGTDPVAMDRIGWEIIDAKRIAEGWPPIGLMGTAGSVGLEGRTKPTKVTESFHIRQPEHVPLSATLGLGVFDRAKIEHLRYNIT